MLKTSAYVASNTTAPQPLTDVECPYAPQSGVHLYHFAMSLCSQKVRQVLEEAQVPWESHPILLSAEEQYDPDYVRINSRCVVPTLVRDGKVTTDSENILRYVANHLHHGAQLIPARADEAANMKVFLDLADALFVEALTYGDLPSIKKPFLIEKLGRGSHEKKVEMLTTLAEKHASDPYLKAAYEGKLNIVQSTIGALHSRDQLLEIMAETKHVVERLNRQLEAGPFTQGGWLCSKTFSLADIEWGVVLYRFQWIGLGDYLWSGKPHVAGYTRQLFSHPSFQSGVIDWTHKFRQILLPTLAKKIKGRFGRG
jgi:glutathione S-transferase